MRRCSCVCNKETTSLSFVTRMQQLQAISLAKVTVPNYKRLHQLYMVLSQTSGHNLPVDDEEYSSLIDNNIDPQFVLDKFNQLQTQSLPDQVDNPSNHVEHSNLIHTSEQIDCDMEVYLTCRK